MPDVIDFLVLRQQFDEARRRHWSIGMYGSYSRRNGVRGKNKIYLGVHQIVK